MLDLDYLPPIHEEEMEVGREYKVRVMLPSCQIVAMAACGSEIRGEKEVHSLQSSPEEAVSSEDALGDVIMIDGPPIEGRNRDQPSDATGEPQSTSSRVTRSASKRQGKTVENWTMANIDGNGKDVVDVPVALLSFKSELQDTKDKLAASKKDLKEAKAKLSGNKKDLATCRRDLRESRGFSSNLKKANIDLQKTLKAYQEELSRCKDDLFSLQGVAQTPDSVITKEFGSISQQIVNLIDTEIAAYARANPRIEPDHVFSGTENKPVADFLQRHPGGGEHLARYLIHRFLQHHVFGKKDYFFGLTEETAHLLQAAESGFAKLDPPRDSVAIASWRSETLKALDTTTACGRYCEQQSQNLNRNLLTKLSVTFPVLFSGPQIHATFFDQVLLPAVKLANTMKASTSDYRVWVPETLFTRSPPATMNMLGRCKMVDFQTGKHLKPDSAVVPDKDGAIGNIIICVEPCLYRATKDKPMVLQQETVLVELFHPLGPRVKPST